MLRRIWFAVGWFGLALDVYLSLMPDPPDIGVPDGDKLEHALAYAVLMLWFAQLAPTWRRRLMMAIALVGLGIALEFAQRATGYRTFSYGDMAADAVGVMAGGLLASWGLPNLLSMARDMASSRAGD